MANMKFQRTSEFVNRFRNYQIYIDGRNIGTIANGETKEFPITAGQHKVIARIDWCSSQEIDFEVGETQTIFFRIGGFKNGKWIVPLGIGLFILAFVLNIFFDNKLSLFFALPVFGILVYYITIGRKKYLILSENIFRD